MWLVAMTVFHRLEYIPTLNVNEAPMWPFNVMTLSEFTRDVIPIVQAALTLVGLASLVLVWWQVRESRRWNQLNAVLTLTKLDAIAKTEQALSTSFAAIGIDLGTQNGSLTAEQVTRVRTNQDAISAVYDHLAELEYLGIALSAGIADDHYARAIHGARLAHAWTVFSPLIRAIRVDAGGSSVYAEIERTALRWHEQDLIAQLRRAKDEALNAKRIENLQKRIAVLENEARTKQ